MIISRIETEQYIYFNLHAEQIITSNYLVDDTTNIGIFEERLFLSTFERVVKSLSEISKSKAIVLDFKFITTCQPNFSDRIVDLRKNGYTIIFLNISQKLVNKESGIKAIQNSNNILTEGEENYSRYYFFEEKKDIQNVEIDTSTLFKDYFKEIIKKYITINHNRPHSSSFVYLNSYVDLKRFMSFEKELTLYSLYRLALKMKEEWKLTQNTKNKTLTCLSLNSSYIVSILSIFLKLDVLIFDKIGPINKLYSRPHKIIDVEKEYIVVSDMVCLGTEVKIVKNILNFFDANYLGHVALIKTETLGKGDIEKPDTTIAVFSINSENNKELGCGIYTDLQHINTDK